MWKDDRLLEDVNGKCVEELMGDCLGSTGRSQWVQAVGMLCHGCPHRSPN